MSGIPFDEKELRVTSVTTPFPGGSRGKPCDLHSCGNLLKQVPNIIKAGWDSWTPQVMNDTWKIYDLYGDKLLISVVPEQFDPESVSEEEQRKYAR
ncbi:MAG: hypothetical protein LBL13_13490, partial [Bacteroidales bacterium]|nr:hypothetical protein [Bacteroidales bacterium]